MGMNFNGSIQCVIILNFPQVFGASQTIPNSLKKTGFICLFSPAVSGGYVICNNILQGKSISYTIDQLK